MAKVFTYRGKTIEELQAMSVEEFAGLSTSGIKRTVKRGLDKKILKRVEASRKVLAAGKYPKAIRTHQRETLVLPSMVGLPFELYNGKEFIRFEIAQEMLGHRLGEFVLTRKRLRHGKAGIGATRSSTAITAR